MKTFNLGVCLLVGTFHPISHRVKLNIYCEQFWKTCTNCSILKIGFIFNTNAVGRALIQNCLPTCFLFGPVCFDNIKSSSIEPVCGIFELKSEDSCRHKSEIV